MSMHFSNCRLQIFYSSQDVTLWSLVVLLIVGTQWSTAAAQRESSYGYLGTEWSFEEVQQEGSYGYLGTAVQKGAISSFVQTRGRQFFLDGKPLYVNGANFYWLMYFAADPASRHAVTEVLQQSANLGLTVGRTWAFNDGSYRALQKSPGVYDENVFQALDFVVAEAKRQGIRLILTFTNNYSNFGGKAQYVQWASQYAGIHLNSEDAFYTDPTIRGWYKNYIKTVLTRVNTVTGVAYRDEPAIFAWELMNEARCISDPSGNTLQVWIEEMAAYVKSWDSNHLLEVGLEGFYGSGSQQSSYRENMNPQSSASQLGTDFIHNNQVAGIDFVTVHSYADIWVSQLTSDGQVSFLQNWVDCHIQDAEFMNKPVLFAEFGKSSRTPGFWEGERDQVMGVMYDKVFASARTGGAGAGALVWQVLTDPSLGDGYEIILSQDSSTSSLMQSQSNRLSQL